MATDNPFGHDFGLGPHHLDDGLLTPMPPCGTPSFEQYMPDHESLSLTQWRKSPAISATMSWGGFRPMDYGTSLNTTWDFHQATAPSSRSPMVNATSSDVRKVEYGNAAAGPSTVNDNTNGHVPSISADNSAVTIHKVDNSPVQSASSHPTYPAPRLLHGGNGEVALKVDTNVQGLTHKHPTYPHHVNPSDFQPVSNNDWCLKMPAGQDASSPSTIDTPCDGPLTPPGDDIGIAPQGILLSNAPATLPHMPQEDYGQTSSGFPIPPTFAFPTPFSSFSSNYEASPTVWSTGPNFTYSGSVTDYHNTHNQPMLGFGSEARQEAPLLAPRPTRLTSTTSFENMARGAMDTTPEPSEVTEDEEESEPELDINDQAVSEANHRLQRDRFLLQMRSQGLSYKEIKRRGRFREAESTLRGRVRVLTKKKEDRVRKPEWTINDVGDMLCCLPEESSC